MAMSKRTDTSVLIIGGGPIGLALAADLGRRGIDVSLIERRDGRLGPARMLEVGVRTMEFCRQLGIVDEVRNWGWPSSHSLDSVFVTNLNGYELSRLKVSTLAANRASPPSPERTVPCPQTWFDPIVKRCAQSFPTVKLRYQLELEDFVQDGDGVTAIVRDEQTGIREEIRALYLIGCDGTDSTVRALLGIQVRGRPHIDWSMNIYLRIPDFLSSHKTPEAFRYVFVGPKGTWSFLTTVDGKELFRLQLLGIDKDALERTDVGALMRCLFDREVSYTVESKVLWVRKMTVADRFRDGRVFLAGDAGHAHPPNGGLGMNTGIQDSFDLGWKLAAVLQGWGGPCLLDSYDLERRPASARATEVSVINLGRLRDGSDDPDIEAATAQGEAARKRVGARLLAENEKSWQPPGAHLGHIYQPSPIVVPDDTPRPMDDAFRYVPTAFPGARAPHFWLSPNRSVIDLFGDGFTLLVFGNSSVASLEEAARRRGVPLQTRRILDPQAAALYARRIVLVRPDGHVAWRADALPNDCLALIDTVRGSGLNAAARRLDSPAGRSSCGGVKSAQQAS
jgi:2-polyprenyl-6-methoxyphenol hydroxylase-like FAD-dependent oxidoreductase